MKKSNRGGARPGAGRPRPDGNGETKRFTCWVEPELIDKADRIGKGNKSLGVRIALKQVQEDSQ